MEREYASAEELGALIRDLCSVVPGLEELAVEVVRLSPPDRSGLQLDRETLARAGRGSRRISPAA